MRFIPLTFILTFLLCPPSFAQITLTLNAGMNFGNLMFDATHSGTITLGTNGTIGVSGTGLAHTGGGYAGDVSIEGSGEVVEIKCSSSALLSLKGNKINLTSPEIVVDTGVNTGNALSCNGTRKKDAVVTTIDLSSNPTPNILMGGTLTIDSNSLTSGVYDTAGGGGSSPVTLSVVVQ